MPWLLLLKIVECRNNFLTFIYFFICVYNIARAIKMNSSISSRWPWICALYKCNVFYLAVKYFYGTVWVSHLVNIIFMVLSLHCYMGLIKCTCQIKSSKVHKITVYDFYGILFNIGFVLIFMNTIQSFKVF